jgi:hypothetical protein
MLGYARQRTVLARQCAALHINATAFSSCPAINFLSCCLAQNFWRQSKHTSEIACAESAFGREWYVYLVSFHVSLKQEPIQVRFELRFHALDRKEGLKEYTKTKWD